MNKTIVHIVSHTHWDREWYLNSPYVNEWLPPFFDALFAMMDKEPDYRFVLDGQTSMLDDCCEQLEKLGCSSGDFWARVETYARQGRLVLGPYYLQPDWQLISEESIIRNMLIGRQMSQKLGGETKTGWLLDNFGQIAQAPQIHKQFGMLGIVVWRGVELDPQSMRSEFLWRSPDGTVMPCGYLLSSYRNAMRLADYTSIVQQRIRNEVEKIAPFAGTSNVLLMNGYDQEMQPDDILPHIQKGKADFGKFIIRQSTPDEYMSALADGIGQAQELGGALYSGRYISVFPGILSSRMYLKQMNHFSQMLLSHFAEPLSVMSMLLSGEYPVKDFERAWKLLLKNHAHDSICGVSVDDVHTDMEHRFAEVDNLSKNIVERGVSFVAGAADTSSFDGAKNVFTIFNTLPISRYVQAFLPGCDGEVRDYIGNSLSTQAVPSGLLARVELPAMGFSTVGVYSVSSPSVPTAPGDLCAENNYLQIKVNQDGTLRVKHKATGRMYDNIGYFEDSADSGDEYNYSWLSGDKPLTTIGEVADVTCIERGELRTVFKIVREWKLPAALVQNRKSRSNDIIVIPVVTFVTLEKDSERIEFCTILKNRCRDHRLRVLFPTQIKTETSLAHTQFCITSHPVHPAAADNSKIPPEVSRIIIGARESEAITQFPQQEFVAVQDGSVGVAVLNRGLPEYEVFPENTTIALTLFRSVGWLTRFDLNTRIGDAGPEMFVPDAQCLREMRLEYAFMPYSEELALSSVLSASQSYQVPPLVAKNSAHLGEIRPEMSFLSAVQMPGLRYSAVKKADKGEDVLIRVYNIGDKGTDAKVEAQIKNACALSLAEEKFGGLDIASNVVTLPIAPCQISTISCRIETRRVTSHEIAAKLCPFWESSVDLSEYSLPSPATEEEILREEHRADTAESHYAKAQEQLAQLKKELADRHPNWEEETTLAEVSLQAQSFLRAALEARLSAMLARKNFLGQEPDFKLTKAIRKIAYQLNLARIDKRVGEYIKDYYEQNCPQEEN